MINYRHDKEISDAQLRTLYQAVGWTAYLDQVSDLGQMLAASQDVISAWAQDQLVGLVRTVGDPRHLSSASLSEAGHRPTIVESNSGSQPRLSSGLPGDGHLALEPVCPGMV